VTHIGTTTTREQDIGFTRLLQVLLVAAVLVSIVHYVDNVIRFEDYAPDEAGLVTAPLVAASWFVFTGFGLWGYLSYRRGHYRGAAVGPALYSVSGLVGIVHYREVSPSDFDLLQNTFVSLDILLGAAILAMACRLAWRAPGGA
jgi:hypothetical protein